MTLDTTTPVAHDEETNHSSSAFERRLDATLVRPTSSPLPKLDSHRSKLIEPPEVPSQRPARYRDRFPNGVNWANAIWMTIMHVGAVAALWHFTWPAFAVFLFLHWVTACLGITLGFHRLLTHGSLVVPRILNYFFTLCGMLAVEGSPLFWVATNHHPRIAAHHHPQAVVLRVVVPFIICLAVIVITVLQKLMA